MSNSNYLRKYKLYVGFPDNYNVVDPSTVKEGEVSKVKENGTPRFVSIHPKGQGILIEDVRIKCEVSSSMETSGSDTKKGKIHLYNINQKTRAVLAQKNVNIILKAGYKEDYDQDSLPILLTGQISSATFKRTDTETITTLDVVDGYVPHTSAKINYTMSANYLNPITARHVLEYLVEAWRVNGITSDNATIEYDLILDSVKFYAGWTGVGYLKDVMDRFTESIGMEWYITNGSLYVQRKGSVRVSERFTPNNLNIISIEPIVNPTRSSSELEDKSRIKVEMFLDGRVKEGAFIDITNSSVRPDKENLAGLYKIKTVKHSFDSYQGESKTTIEAERT